MQKKLLRGITLAFLSICLASAQAQAPDSDRVSSSDAIDRVLMNNVLTFQGVPFHAIVDISDEKGDAQYIAKVEIFWAAPEKYRLLLTSPIFSQTLIVNGADTEEQDNGDFYPGWLHRFVVALLDPMPRQSDLRNSGPVALGEQSGSPCIKHEERTNGITNDLTFSFLCFGGNEPHLNFAEDFSYSMEFSDYKSFANKVVARTYITGWPRDKARLHGIITTLETLKTMDESMFAVQHPTPQNQRIQTILVSTAQEESMVEAVPTDIHWPTVREGKLEGYMIVNALTDRMGQVREVWKHNSDNMAVESYGNELALKYKFKPLIVDGIAQQMETPLVLHFKTTVDDPIPELDNEQSRKIITGCNLPHEIADPASAGKQITIQIQVSEDGHIMTLGASDRKIPSPALYQQFRSCTFNIYRPKGSATAYHANLSVQAH